MPKVNTPRQPLPVADYSNNDDTGRAPMDQNGVRVYTEPPPPDPPPEEPPP